MYYDYNNRLYTANNDITVVRNLTLNLTNQTNKDFETELEVYSGITEGKVPQVILPKSINNIKSYNIKTVSSIDMVEDVTIAMILWLTDNRDNWLKIGWYVDNEFTKILDSSGYYKYDEESMEVPRSSSAGADYYTNYIWSVAVRN